MKPISIGNDDFKSIIEGNFYYIDKTQFIEEIINDFIGAKLFLRPRRFGKTTNMLMLKEYFDITKKEENKDLFKGLYIDSIEECKKYQNAYPTIFITLKESKQSNWEDMYENFKNIMMKLYNENDYVKSVLKESEIKIYERIINKKASEVEYQNSLRDLSEYLYKYYGKKAIVLIDEYDAPLNQAYTKGFGDKAIDFMRTFLSSALKTNQNLQVGVLTGVLQIGQQSIFSDLNNLEVYSIARKQGSEYFGFTLEEVKQMLIEYKLESQLDNIIKWYNGYNFNGIQIFNPWSILNCVKQKGEFKTYWLNTGNSNLIELATEGISAKTAEAIAKLLENKPVEVPLREKSIYEELKGNITSFINTLLFTGYLTIERVYDKENDTYVEVRIPNEEIRRAIVQIQKRWLSSEQQSIILNNIRQGIILQDDELLQDSMNMLLLQESSYFKTREEYFQAMFLIATLELPTNYIRKMENETGYGRSDYEIYKEDKSIGMIFEFKVCDKEKDIEKALEEGMKQIHTMKYYTYMQKIGIKEIWLYSLAFCQKKMLLKKELNRAEK